MMKRPSPKPKRTLRQTLALGLCALLAAASRPFQVLLPC